MDRWSTVRRRPDPVDVYVGPLHYRSPAPRWVRGAGLTLVTFGAWPFWRYLRYLFEGR